MNIEWQNNNKVLNLRILRVKNTIWRIYAHGNSEDISTIVVASQTRYACRRHTEKPACRRIEFLVIERGGASTDTPSHHPLNAIIRN